MILRSKHDLATQVRNQRTSTTPTDPNELNEVKRCSISQYSRCSSLVSMSAQQTWLKPWAWLLLPEWFDSVHAIACPDEKTLYLAEEFSYRFDKVELQ